jgi:hypothetical protein
MALIHSIIKKKFSFLIDFLITVEIEGFGSVESFLDVTKVEHQIVTVKNVISNHTDESCPFLGALADIFNNVSIEITIRVTVKQLHDVVQGAFLDFDDFAIRLHNCSKQMREFRKLAPWIAPIIYDANLVANIGEEEGEEWGDCYDLEFVGQMCSTYSICGGANSGPGTPPPPPTTPPSTPPPTTTPTCNDRPDLIQLNTTGVCTSSKITKSINDVRVTWAFNIQTSFSGTWGSILSNVCSTSLTTPQKINNLIANFNAWNPTGTNYNAMLKAIVIKHWNGVPWGKVKDFCDCGPA